MNFCRVFILLMALLGASIVWGNNGHYVVLSWDPSPTAVGHPTLAYNIYRSATPGGEKNPPLNAAPGAAGCTSSANCVYTDYDVLGGSRYYYTATAVVDGVESVMSNEVSADVPLAPPTGVTVTPR